MRGLITMVTLMLVLNIFCYLGVNFAISYDGQTSLNNEYNFHFNGDLVDTLLFGQTSLDAITNNTKYNYTDYNIQFSGNFTSKPEQQSGVYTGVSGVAFLDPIRILWAFILMLFNIALSPLTLFFNFGIPVFFGLMIGVPYFVILIFTIYALIRGAND